MAANLSVKSSYRNSELEQFYLNVKCGDILHFTFDSRTCPRGFKGNNNYNDMHYILMSHYKHHYGVFIDKPGLESYSQMCVVHLDVLPNRVEWGFLKRASTLAKEGMKKWQILSSVALYQIDKVFVNSIEELFLMSKTEKITIDNDLTTFWNDEQDKSKKSNPCPSMDLTFSQYTHTCKEWAEILKREV